MIEVEYRDLEKPEGESTTKGRIAENFLEKVESGYSLNTPEYTAAIEQMKGKLEENKKIFE
ncbi:hypothetical protein KKH82_08795 [Patescibacteria group bacterium]|nr:hypothetical protein [Patescibacteria group bacterium]